MNRNESEIILRKDREWSLVDSRLCLITDFLPFMGSIVKDGKAISPVTTAPYASITVEYKGTHNKITGFITHKMDFINLWSAFRERVIDEKKEEVLIYWTTKHYKYKVLKIFSAFILAILGASPLPKIIVMICPKGTYKKLSDDFPLLSKEEILVFVYGLASLKWWIPDVMR